MNRRYAKKGSLIAYLIVIHSSALAIDCVKPPEQATKDWKTEVETAVAKIGPIKGAELKTKVDTTTRDLLGKLPEAGRLYLEQMMFAAYCSGLQEDNSIPGREKSKLVLQYRREVRKTIQQFYSERSALQNPAKALTRPRNSTKAQKTEPAEAKCTYDNQRLEKVSSNTDQVPLRPTDHFWLHGPSCILAQVNSVIVRDSVTIESQGATDDKPEQHEVWGKVLIDQANIQDERFCYSLQCRGAPSYYCKLDYKITWYEQRFSSAECKDKAIAASKKPNA